MSGGAPGDRPLAGVGVAVTRAEPPDGPLSRRLERAGARPVSWQATEIVPPADPMPMRRALGTLSRYSWVVFSSAQGVAAFAAALGGRRSGKLPQFAVVGRATARAAESAGFVPSLVPEDAGAEALVEAFRRTVALAGARVLLPASASARPELAAGLAALGAIVDSVAAYETRALLLDGSRCRADLAAGRVEIVTFTSPSGVASVVAAFGDLTRELERARRVSIGPTTTAELSAAGFPPHAEAQPSSLDGLVAAAASVAQP